MKRVLKTKDLQTVLYSIVKQLKIGDEFGYKICDEKQSSISLSPKWSVEKNEVEVLRQVGKIKKVLGEGKAVCISINEITICKVVKSVEGFIVEDFSEKLVEFIFFEMIGECKSIKVEYIKKHNPFARVSYKFTLKSTYLTDHIINVDNLYDTFSYISKLISGKLEELLKDEENCIINITTEFVKEKFELQKEYTFSTEIVF